MLSHFLAVFVRDNFALKSNKPPTNVYTRVKCHYNAYTAKNVSVFVAPWLRILKHTVAYVRTRVSIVHDNLMIVRISRNIYDVSTPIRKGREIIVVTEYRRNLITHTHTQKIYKRKVMKSIFVRTISFCTQ